MASRKTRRAARPRLRWLTTVVTAAVVVGVGAMLALRLGGNPGSAGAPVDRATEIPRIRSLDGLDKIFAGAVVEAVAAVERTPGSASTWGQLGRLYQAHDYLDLARRAYEAARVRAPNEAVWTYYLGYLAADRGDAGAALAYYRETVERRPDYVPAYYRLGNLHLAQDRLDEAEAVYRQLVDRAPRQQWGHLGLGKSSRRRGDADAAHGHLAEALRLDDNNRETLYLQAMTHIDRGDRAAGERLLEDLDDRTVSALDDPMLVAVLRQTRDSQALIQAANELVSQKRYDRAESSYLRVLEADPESYDALVNMGVLLGLTDRNSEAEAMLQRAVTIDPERAEGHVMLAIAYFQTQRPQQGLAALGRALELDPDHPRALDILRSLDADVR